MSLYVLGEVVAAHEPLGSTPCTQTSSPLPHTHTHTHTHTQTTDEVDTVENGILRAARYCDVKMASISPAWRQDVSRVAHLSFFPAERKQKHGRVRTHILMRLIAKTSFFICSILLCGVYFLINANKPWFYVSAVYCCCGQRRG